MFCLMLQYDLPSDPGRLQEYEKWVVTEVVPSIMRAAGSKTMRAYRNAAGGSPQVTALFEGDEMKEAVSFLGTEIWNSIMTTSRALGINNLQVTLLSPSPLFQGPIGH